MTTCRNHRGIEAMIAEARKMLSDGRAQKAKELLVKAERKATQELDKELVRNMIKGLRI